MDSQIELRNTTKSVSLIPYRFRNTLHRIAAETIPQVYKISLTKISDFSYSGVHKHTVERVFLLTETGSRYGDCVTGFPKYK